MLLLSKIAALGIVIWFYMTAEKNGQPAIKWAIIGLIGFLLGWFVLDFIIDQQLDFTLGNVVKYVCRAKHKGKELEDLKKAAVYLDRQIKLLESKHE